MGRRKTLLILFFSALAVGLAVYFSSEKIKTPLHESKEQEGEFEEHEDGMQLAIKQEFEITKDPATNTVPKQRLLAAYEYAEEQRRQNANRSGGGNTTDAAIPGITWTERGPNNCGGRTRSIMVDPNDATKKTVWAAGVGGGLWKTTDITVASPAWTVVNDFFANIAITTLTYDPSNTLVMYFGSGEGYFNGDAIRGLGIWKSTDGGATWNQLAATNNANFNYVERIAVRNNGEVYAATRAGLRRSLDGGTTWTKVLGAALNAATDNWSDVEMAADNTIWASTFGATDGVYKSATGAAGSWTKLNTGNGFPTAGFDRVDIALAPSNSQVCYAMTEDAATGGLFNLYKTANGGTTWTTLTQPAWHDQQGGCGTGADFTRTQAWYDMSIAVDPLVETTVFIGGVDLFKSTNSGTNWTQISNWATNCFQFVHADQHIAIFEPGNSNVIYFGNDGGVFRSTNATAATPTITSKSNNYNVTQFYSCAVHPTSGSNYFLAGAQDNGSHKYTVAGMNATTRPTGGDGMFCHIDQDQPQYQWTSYVYNNYFRSTDGGATWSGTISNGNTGSFVNPTDYDNVGNIMYGAYSADNYTRWINPQAGATFQTVNITAFNGGSIRHVSVSQNTTHRVFFGLSNGRIVRVDGANVIASGSAGILTGTPVANASVSCIAIENGNDNHILVTYSNYGVTSVWESTNALSAPATFTQVEGNLPDMPVRWALFNPQSSQQAMLATELGVWTTTSLNGAATVWNATNTGLANVCTHMLQLRASDRLVAAATHGRGLYTATFPSLALPVAMIYFKGEPKDDYNLLTWATASEINNRGFEVQRSSNGQNFSPLTFINGAGNSTQTKYYSYKDVGGVQQDFYYRLVQTDYDGTKKTSNTILIKNRSKEKLSVLAVYPNPVRDNFSVSFSKETTSNVAVKIFNVEGKLVFEKTFSPAKEISINTTETNFSSGIYFLKIDADESSFTQRLVKE